MAGVFLFSERVQILVMERAVREIGDGNRMWDAGTKIITTFIKVHTRSRKVTMRQRT